MVGVVVGGGGGGGGRFSYFIIYYCFIYVFFGGVNDPDYTVTLDLEQHDQ